EISKAAVGRPGAGRRSMLRDHLGMQLAPRIESALIELREAYEYACELETHLWDFAVEMPSLRRLHLSRNDLRWMVARGLVEHGVETTRVEDSSRTFRHPPRLLMSRKTCFVLTEAGVKLAQPL